MYASTTPAAAALLLPVLLHMLLFGSDTRATQAGKAPHATADSGPVNASLGGAAPVAADPAVAANGAVVCTVASYAARRFDPPAAQSNCCTTQQFLFKNLREWKIRIFRISPGLVRQR